MILRPSTRSAHARSAWLTSLLVCGIATPGLSQPSVPAPGGAETAARTTPAVSSPVSSPAAGPTAGPASVFRVFLRDGTAIASAGEFARVGDRVVLSLPLSDARQPIVALPAAEVDWARTERYAGAVRAAHYAATRGEADFAEMSTLVARTLSDIAITPGTRAQLALADRARRMLADWPRDHYGYRAEDVRQTLALLDEVIAALRASAGETKFDVSLVADTLLPAMEPMLPPPTLRDAIEQALRLSELAPTGAERVSLVEAARAALAEAPSASRDAAWTGHVRQRLDRVIDAERRIDGAYRNLTVSTMKVVDRRAAATDVRGLLRERSRVVERDHALGRRRPGEIEALLAIIDERLDAARRLRLATDQWVARLPALRAYRDAMKPPLDRLRAARGVLGDIRTLAGPPMPALVALRKQLDALAPFVRAVNAPEDAREAHGAIQTAFQLAGTAARYRQRAIADNDMRAAWDGSAAAAGALLFLDRADALLAGLLTAPSPAPRAPAEGPAAPRSR